MADSIMTLNEVAQYLKLGRRSVYRLANDGKLSGRKVLGRWRFRRDDIDEWIHGPHANERSRAEGETANNKE